MSTDTPPFTELHFIELQRCRVFYKSKATPSTSEKVTIHFVTMLTFLQWSGMSLQYLCGVTVLGNDAPGEGVEAPGLAPCLALRIFLI